VSHVPDRLTGAPLPTEPPTPEQAAAEQAALNVPVGSGGPGACTDPRCPTHRFGRHVHTASRTWLLPPETAPVPDPEDAGWVDRYSRGFTCVPCRGTGRTIHHDLPDGSARAQSCLTCSGSGRQPHKRLQEVVAFGEELAELALNLEDDAAAARLVHIAARLRALPVNLAGEQL